MKCEHVRAAVRLQRENLCSRWLEPNERTCSLANLTKSKADQQFAATQKRAKHAAKEKDKSWQELTERVAKLKALRMAKEAADKEAAEEADAENKKPSRSPQAHRRLS